MQTSITADLATADIASTSKPQTESEGFIATALKIVAGVGEGLRAARRYDELTNAGVKHGEAIRRALEESRQ